MGSSKTKLQPDIDVVTREEHLKRINSTMTTHFCFNPLEVILK